MKPLKEQISITIDSYLLERTKEKAEYYDRSLSRYISIVVKRQIEDPEEQK